MQKFWKINLTLLLITTMVGCTSIKDIKYEKVDYSSSSSVMYEVSVGEKFINDNKTVEALMHAKVLQKKTTGFVEVNQLYDKAVTKTTEAFNKAVKEQKWSDAMRYFKSLASVNEAPTDWTEKSIYELQEQSWRRAGNNILANLNASTNANNSPHNNSIDTKLIAKMIKGTVTVWVDRGMKIEKGLAFADRVIGSGFFIDERGYFITNYHVIQSEVDPNYEGFSRVYIKSPNDKNQRVPAKVIGWDEVFDLALLKTEIEPEVVFKLGSSKDLTVGSKIFAIGSPAGLEKTLTSGIVSAKNRRLFSLGSVLQIDAAINHGNSGGPLIDEKGNVQAVVFAGLAENEGLNFAVPVELLRAVLPSMYAGGKVVHSWLGCYGHTLSPSEEKTLDGVTGIKVDYTMPLGPAYKACISEGSIITQINGTIIKTLEDLQDFTLNESVNTLLKVSGYEKIDDGKYTKSDWYVMLEERPNFPGETIYKNDAGYRAMLPLAGMKLVSSGTRNEYRVKSTTPGSIADEGGFLPNDYIELRKMELHPDIDNNMNVLYIEVYAKRRKSGYTEGFMGFWAYLDSSSYF